MEIHRNPLARLLIVPAIALLLVTAAGLAAAQAGGGGPPAGVGGSNDSGQKCLPGNAYENDDYRIWFHGKKFQLKVFEKSEEGQAKLYQYKSFAVTELDGDNNTAAWMNLERASSYKAECAQVSELNETFSLQLTVTDTVYGGEGGPVGDATVTYDFHFNRSSSAAKFDILIVDWPWQSDGELAYAFDVETDYQVETAENGIGFRDDEGNARGFIEWAMNATATYEDGHMEEAIVESSIDENVDGETAARVTLRFTQASPGYVELDYDPWLGVGPYVIIAGLLLIAVPDVEAIISSVVETVPVSPFGGLFGPASSFAGPAQLGFVGEPVAGVSVDVTPVAPTPGLLTPHRLW